MRSDFTITHLETGIELGLGKVKPPNAEKDLIEEDKTRIPECNKRQVNGRAYVAKDLKELAAFGFMVDGKLYAE